MVGLDWVIKASKLCNLRCRYCYEWNELGDPARIALADWEKLLLAVRDHHERQERRLGGPVRSRLVWHGGEPLALPLDYMEAVVALQHEILGGAALARGDYVNALQTNLYSLTEGKLGFLKRHGFRVGVSMDFVGGVRLTEGGAETEEKVAANMDRLAEAEVPFGAITVLARHTAPHLRQIYDFMEAIGVSFRVLPLFPSPLNTPEADFALAREAMIEALKDLFVHWLDRGCSVPVDPLEQYLENALLKMNGLDRGEWQRSLHGDSVLIVNTNGDLYQVIDAYQPGKSLGTLFRQPIGEILGSPASAASLERSGGLIERHCGGCPFNSVCNKAPLLESRIGQPEHGRCALGYSLQSFIEQHLRALGCDETFLAELMVESRRELIAL